jgi:hypothetical protein
MEPIDTLQSILELPSKGSKVTTYFPYYGISTSIGPSYSSETMTATLLLFLKALTKTSSEITSNFFY